MFSAAVFSFIASSVAHFAVAEECSTCESDQSALLQHNRFGPLKKDALVFGTPLAGYHNVTLWVYNLAMKELDPKTEIKMIIYPHPVLYPMFLGPVAGTPDGCTKPGCADKCAESGLGDASPCIDFVVDSNIPVNHASFGLKDHTEEYDVIGTAFERQYIGVWAPDYMGWTSIDDANTKPRNGTEIIAWKSDEGDGCDTQYCPKCGTGSIPFITQAPLGEGGQNYPFRSLTCTDFVTEVHRKIEAKENFLTLQWLPQAMLSEFPTLVALGMGEYTYDVEPNVGKAQIRKDRKYKFTSKQLAVLGAIFIGTQDVQNMDAWSHNIDLPWVQHDDVLCDYESWNNGCAKEAAELWVTLNKDHETPNKTKQGVWETFFW